jgi:hypothetical protein
MTHRLNKAGVALLAALAFGVFAASAAQASVFYTKETKYPVSITGTSLGEQVLKVHVETGKNSEIKCTGFSMTGTLPATSSTLTLHPIYTGCTAFGAAAAVNTEGCNYVLHSKEWRSLDEYFATTDVACGAGQFINVATATCELHITPQNGLTFFALTDSTAAGNVLYAPLINAFAYSVIKDGLGCPLTGVENRVDGSFKAGGAKLSAKFGGLAWPLIVE